MKSLVLFACILAVAYGLPQDYRNSYITRYSFDQYIPYGYRFLYDTSDHSNREEIGAIKNEGRDDEALEVRGIYSYVGPDGVTYTVAYIADENGFRPEGEHLPPAADVKKTKPLGIPSSAIASLAG